MSCVPPFTQPNHVVDELLLLRVLRPAQPAICPLAPYLVITGLISQGYWESSKWYFVNVERGNIADKLQPRNINVSFTNNSNVPIDVIIFTFYNDQLEIDVETGIVTK